MILNTILAIITVIVAFFVTITIGYVVMTFAEKWLDKLSEWIR